MERISSSRRGSKRTLTAVAHSLPVMIHPLLPDGTTDADLGAHYYDERRCRPTVQPGFEAPVAGSPGSLAAARAAGETGAGLAGGAAIAAWKTQVPRAGHSLSRLA